MKQAELSEEETEMTKMFCFAVAFMLFAPMAAATVLQAAQIVG